MAGMSEPTEPDSQPETEPVVELDAAPETEAESAHETTTQPGAAPDVAPEADLDVAMTPEASPAFSTRQAIVISAALVVALALSIGLILILRSDDKAKPVSAEDQAKTAAVAMFHGIYKVARGDTAGCQDLVDNLALTPEQGNFFNDCVAKIPTEPPTAATVVLDSVNPTQVTLDEAAGTGTVLLDVSTTENGKSETQPASVPVIKVDGRWKVSLNANPTP